MNSTAPNSWHLLVEFIGLDLDDDQVVDALFADPAHLIMWSSSEGVTTAVAEVAVESLDEALAVVTDTATAAAPHAQAIRLVDPLVAISDIAEEAGDGAVYLVEQAAERQVVLVDEEPGGQRWSRRQ